MRRSPFRSFVLLSILGLTLGACSDAPNTPTTPTTPATEITEPAFAGTLTVNGGATQVFSATSLGNVSASITELDANPDSTPATVGISLGTWNGSYCQVFVAKDDAVLGSALVATPTSALLSVCARVYDTGKLLGPVNYSIELRHY